jgi:hypothetical protein
VAKRRARARAQSRENAGTRAGDRGSGPTRSSVNGRIAIARPCHLHDPPTKNHPAWESISLETPPASLRCALSLARRPGCQCAARSSEVGRSISSLGSIHLSRTPTQASALEAAPLSWKHPSFVGERRHASWPRVGRAPPRPHRRPGRCGATSETRTRGGRAGGVPRGTSSSIEWRPGSRRPRNCTANAPASVEVSRMVRATTPCAAARAGLERD